MKYLKALLFLIIASMGSLSAQTFVGKLNPNPGQTQINSDNINILAFMIDFQEDDDPLTYGTGKFGSLYSEDYGNTILDPLPHDAQYFEDHLLFAKNYYEKVSKGNVNVSFDVFPNVITMPNTMRTYSPPNTGNDMGNLVNLCTDFWQIVADQNTGIDFSKYNVFAVFHAGAGRDVSLPGSLGNEKDLPSVYVNLKTFQQYLGNDFSGFEIQNGFKIQNTMILPETESRELEYITGKTLLQLSINGLIAGSIGSYLGLPDLFDTETGLSAIGRFGLMDGQSLFAYSGTFPPEPSPWEKQYLGWITPVDGSLNGGTIEITTPEISSAGDVSILKLPLNSKEYYLIENRSRDANNDGAIVTYKLNGEIKTAYFEKDTTGFYSYDSDSLKGVIIDVDEFDWAVPGNGIAVWHIDEGIIAEKMPDNKINADQFMRGVDLEEADGVQDIGVQFQTIFGDIVIGEGYEEDLWFNGNPAELYRNVFGPGTKPSTISNSGAASNLVIQNFSDISNKMTFAYSYSSNAIKLLTVKNISNSADYLSVLSRSNDNILYTLSGNKLLRYDNSGNLLNSFDNFSSFKPLLLFDEINNAEYAVGILNSKTNILQTINGVSTIKSFDAGSELTTYPVLFNTDFNNGTFNFLVGNSEGKVIKSQFKSADFSISSENVLSLDNSSVQQITTNGVNVAASTNSKIGDVNSSASIFNGSNQLVSFTDVNNLFNAILLGNNNIVSVYSQNGISNFTLPGTDPVSVFAIADILGDGSIYIVYSSGLQLHAVNMKGIELDNFPYEIENYFIGSPLILDLNGDSVNDIISFDENGNINGISGENGKQIPGFPVSGGNTLEANSAVLFSSGGMNSSANDDNVLSFITSNNELVSWAVSPNDFGKPVWSGFLGNPQNSAYAAAPKSENRITEFFPQNKAYNWPNPVYDNETYIRYYVSENADVNIKIFDLAGDLVAEISDKAAGGMDNETTWNVSDIQSGVYFARVEVSGTSGNSGNKIIKIAVIK